VYSILQDAAYSVHAASCHGVYSAAGTDQSSKKPSDTRKMQQTACSHMLYLKKEHSTVQADRNVPINPLPPPTKRLVSTTDCWAGTMVPQNPTTLL
jgi:hypothetical protein